MTVNAVGTFFQYVKITYIKFVYIAISKNFSIYIFILIVYV